MRYLLKSGKTPVKIVREEKALIRRSIWRRRLGVIVPAIASGLLATMVTVIFTRHEADQANYNAKRMRQMGAFMEAWAETDLYALEVDRMSRMSGLYLLASSLQQRNGDNPVAKMFVSKGKAQNMEMDTAFKQAEAMFARKQLLLAPEHRHLLKSYLVINQKIINELLSSERREDTNFKVDKVRLEALKMDATRLRAMAEVLTKDPY